jgi:cell filamentation protein
VGGYTDANGVYFNKLGITDEVQLKLVEYQHAQLRADEILTKRVDLGGCGFGFVRQQAFHQHLFQDVYEWAGKPRTTPASKSMGGGMWSEFATPETFAEKWQALGQKTAAFATAKGLTFGQKVELLVGIFVEANHIHPFPEGNGRSLQVFMQQLAREQGVELDYTKNDAVEWNHASAVSGRHGPRFEHQFLMPRPTDLEPIKKIFAAMARPSLEEK